MESIVSWRYEDKYELDIARGASHVASMLYPHTINKAIEDTVREFQSQYGHEDIQVFLKLLLRELKRRNRPEAVALLKRLIARSFPSDASDTGSSVD